MGLLISPPETSGVIKVLDQINQKLHLLASTNLDYKTTKQDLSTLLVTINQGFMSILTNKV